MLRVTVALLMTSWAAQLSAQDLETIEQELLRNLVREQCPILQSVLPPRWFDEPAPETVSFLAHYIPQVGVALFTVHGPNRLAPAQKTERVITVAMGSIAVSNFPRTRALFGFDQDRSIYNTILWNNVQATYDEQPAASDSITSDFRGVAKWFLQDIETTEDFAGVDLDLRFLAAPVDTLGRAGNATEVPVPWTVELAATDDPWYVVVWNDILSSIVSYIVAFLLGMIAMRMQIWHRRRDINVEALRGSSR